MRSDRQQASRCATAAIFGLMAAAACSANSHPKTTGQRSLTPDITASAASPLRAGLVTQADLGSAPSVTGIQVGPLEPGQFFTDPDPRGPCGAKVAQPDLGGAAAEALGGAVNGAELIVQPGAATAEGFVSAVQHDTRPGCASWHSLTNTGASQTGEMISPLPLNVPADQATAALIKLTSVGQTFIATEIILRDGGTLSFTIMLSTSAPPAAALQLLALKEANRLRLVAS